MLTRRSLLAAVGAASLLPELVHARAVAAVPAAPPVSDFTMVVSLEPAQAGAGNHRWAWISDGLVEGGALQGRVQAGRIDWHVDPASGAVEAGATCSVLCGDGRVAELRREGLGAVRLENGLVRLRAF